MEQSDEGYFNEFGVSNINLRVKVVRKMSKKRALQYKKREDNTYLKGRLKKDFDAFMEENPDASVVEIDTVYNDVTNGPFMQTFKFLDYGFIFIIYHETKAAQDMLDGVLLLEVILSSSSSKRKYKLFLQIVA